MKPLTVLTPELQDTLFEIHQYQSNTQRYPSYDELMVLLNLSRGGVRHRIRSLEKLGYITIGLGARSIRLTQHVDYNGVRVPVVGEVN